MNTFKMLVKVNSIINEVKDLDPVSFMVVIAMTFDNYAAINREDSVEMATLVSKKVAEVNKELGKVTREQALDGGDI